MKHTNYNIGIDIGTSSVGLAVTGEDGRLLKFKGKNRTLKAARGKVIHKGIPLSLSSLFLYRKLYRPEGSGMI